MKKIIFVVCITLTGTMHCYFEKYRAQRAYKQGDNKQAQYLLDEMLTQDPDNAEVAYNLGKVALKEKEFSKAAAYFNAVTQSASASLSLHEQAWYDLGISNVHLKQWEEALASFQEVLKINSENEYAQKMIDQIKKILEEKKQQEQEQKQDKHSDDSKSEQNKQDKQENDSDKNDQKNQKDDKDDDSEKDNQKKDDSSENKDRDSSSQKDEKENENSDEESKPDKDSEQNGDEQEKQQPQENNDHNEKNNADKKQNEQAQNQQSDLNKPDEQKNDQSQPSQNQPEEALQEAKNDGKNDTQAQQKPADKETMLLQLVEKHDAQMSKALFKRQVQQQMPSRHGQKNW